MRPATKQRQEEFLVNENLQNMNGIAALKSLTNGLFAALYTSGWLRVFRISNGKTVMEKRLDGCTKVVRAQIASISQARVVEDSSISKTIKIGVTSLQ